MAVEEPIIVPISLYSRRKDKLSRQVSDTRYDIIFMPNNIPVVCTYGATFISNLTIKNAV